MNNLILNLFAKLQPLKNDEDGQDLVEYALLVALVALVSIAAVSGVGTAIISVFVAISNSLA